ncbi:hypothetical protein FACS1894127_1210 [Clostridia bacterium]|nr:hypothetical protein FACS1894127_1210 [Clostridia bacterium]
MPVLARERFGEDSRVNTQETCGESGRGESGTIETLNTFCIANFTGTKKIKDAHRRGRGVQR